MPKKKKQIYCRCGSPANWYKKGKNHRVLVCNRCGVIANNPIPLLAAGLAMAPQIIDTVSGLIPSKKEKSPTHEKPETIHHIHDSLDKPNYSERVVNKMLAEK